MRGTQRARYSVYFLNGTKVQILMDGNGSCNRCNSGGRERGKSDTTEIYDICNRFNRGAADTTELKMMLDVDFSVAGAQCTCFTLLVQKTRSLLVQKYS